MLFEHLVEVVAGILAAAITMKISPAALSGLRRNQAISRASITRLRRISVASTSPPHGG